MKQVYILLSRTETLPSKVIGKATGGAQYTHASIALTPETNRLYSYARQRLHNPFIAGLIREDIHDFVFARYPNCPCVALMLNVSDESYCKMQERLSFFIRNKRRAKYNFIGVLPLRAGICWKRKYHLTCSQFVAVILSAAPEIKLPKDPYLMMPTDFTEIPGIIPIYSGQLKDCSFARHSIHHPTKALKRSPS